jgi:aminopeptidase N
MMSRKWYVAIALAVLPLLWWGSQRMGSSILPVTPPTEGISRTLARERAANIHSVRYALALKVPADVKDVIDGSVTIRMFLERKSAVILDFAQPADHVSSVEANGQAVPVRLEHGHIVIPAEPLRAGENTIEIAFTAGNEALNRESDYLYSLFVPARASRAFPCFDQPDMKASLALTLQVPDGWAAVSNGREISRAAGGGTITMRFAETQPLPTYLFAFAAGRFSVERGERAGRPFYLYHRETDPQKVAENREAVFDLHQQSLQWLEEYTGRRYPFEKLDFVLLPNFQFSGMEHAGAIYYSAPALFLDKTATQEQRLSRANLIAHETAHMWFGDLVTMQWFDDVWLKEVFANFMAAKIANPMFPDLDHDVRFLLQHYPSAYDVDRTTGANPIRQPLENLKDAGALYGPIIYNKAPIVMRQLEALLGAEQFRAGLREYLSRYAFANATWDDLIAILDERTKEDLAAWSRIWVDEPGRPTISTDLQLEAGRVTTLRFAQTDPSERKRARVWNQRLQVTLGYENGARISVLNMNANAVDMPGAGGLPAPLYVLANGEGIGYGLFKPHPATRQFFLRHLPEVGNALTRATAWLMLWDDLLEGATPPADLFALMLRALPQEPEEQIVERMLGYAQDLYWRYLPPAARRTAAAEFERVLLNGMTTAAGTSLKSAYFNAYRRSVTTAEGLARLERIWRRQEVVSGLTFAETDDINMAQELALRNVSTTGEILDEQLRKIRNADRRARLAFVAPALSSDPGTRDAFFDRLQRQESRQHEPWVVDALRFLNHPLRQEHAQRYIQRSLDWLPEIQRTGDIFFPSRWTASVLDGHNSGAAAATVKAFLEAHGDYPPRIRQIIEQAADRLFRSAAIAR